MSPKYNPKHKNRTKSSKTTKQAKKYMQRKKWITLIVIAAVIGVSIVGIFIGKFGYDEWALNHIQKGDRVTMELRIWKADDEGNYINSSIVVWNSTTDPLIKTIKDTANETGMPYGLWDQLLGMKFNETREKLWLPRCVDDLIPIPEVEFHEDAIAGDGWDDRYNPGSRRYARCYSFGYDTTSELGINLRFTPIIYWIHIVDLEKEI
ncbi:MAG: hypothetical protein ACTSRE_00505 [Promethearchaeota archaeon]